MSTRKTRSFKPESNAQGRLPANAEVVTVNFREGFDPSPDNSSRYDGQYLKDLDELPGDGSSSVPGDTPVIT